MKTSEEKLSLSNIGSGVAIEKFDAELQKVLDNIKDPNAKGGKRVITLTVGITPDQEGDFLSINTDATCKLQSDETVNSRACIDTNIHGKAEAREILKERTLFDNNVTSIEAGKGNQTS